MTMNDFEVNPIITYPAGIYLQQETTDKRASWDIAIDVVTYPVSLRSLFYQETDEHDNVEMRNAAGVTNTGRDVEFFGVVTDKNRTGEQSVISVVTGMYDTIAPADIYASLRDDLASLDVKSEPMFVYVSGNGGSQELRIEINDMEWVSGNNKITLCMVVNTSLDGTKRHSVRIAAVDEHGTEIIGASDTSFNLSARHTRTIRMRHAAFTTVIEALIKEWNTSIIPFMQLMNNCKFDKSTAVDILSNIMEDANIPKRHQEKAMAQYESLARREDTLYGAMHSVSSYFSSELASKPERMNLLREKLVKSSQKTIKKTLAKFG
jgi:hypothetical protein